MASSLFTQAGLDAIEEAIAGGHLEVEYDNKRVRYRSLDEMLQIRDLIRGRLSNTSPRRYVKFGKGL